MLNLYIEHSFTLCTYYTLIRISLKKHDQDDTMILFSKSKELSFTWILSFHFLPQAYNEGRGKTHSISYGLERSERDSWTYSLGAVVSRGVTWSTEVLQKMQNQAFLLSLIVGIELFEKQLRISKAKLYFAYLPPLC